MCLQKSRITIYTEYTNESNAKMAILLFYLTDNPFGELVIRFVPAVRVPLYRLRTYTLSVVWHRVASISTGRVPFLLLDGHWTCFLADVEDECYMLSPPAFYMLKSMMDQTWLFYVWNFIHENLTKMWNYFVWNIAGFLPFFRNEFTHRKTSRLVHHKRVLLVFYMTTYRNTSESVKILKKCISGLIICWTDCIK